jgi:hypothetical protein
MRCPFQIPNTSVVISIHIVLGLHGLEARLPRHHDPFFVILFLRISEGRAQRNVVVGQTHTVVTTWNGHISSTCDSTLIQNETQHVPMGLQVTHTHLLV